MTRGLPQNSRVAVVAPAGRFDVARANAGRAVLEARGLRVDPLPDDPADPEGYLAADDATRARRLRAALTDPDVDAVWAVRGGYGVTRLLDGLDLDALLAAARPRPLVGFSDLTPLLHALAARGWPAIHGPVLTSLAATDPADLPALWACLDGRPPPPLRGQAAVAGTAAGPLVGGNLALLAATAGTPWAVAARDAVLVLEDVGEPLYRLDRMLTQLASAGLLAGVRAVLLGTFTDCRPPAPAADPEAAVRDALAARVAALVPGVPVVTGLPIGHGSRNAAWPVGVPVDVEDGVMRWQTTSPQA